jgi:hypothetical protein
MVNRDEKPSTGEGGKSKRVRTTSDDVSRKSVSEKSKSVGGKCVCVNSTGGKSGVIRNSGNIFKTSRRDKTHLTSRRDSVPRRDKSHFLLC